MRVTTDTNSLLPSLYSYAVPIYHVSLRTVIEASDLRLADQPIGQSSLEIRPLLLKSVLKQRKQEEDGQESKCEAQSLVSIPVSPLKSVVHHFDNTAILYMSS